EGSVPAPPDSELDLRAASQAHADVLYATYTPAELQRLAAARGATAAQLALAWLLAQGDAIVPIPGARSLAHLEENVAAAQIKLGTTELAAIAAAIPPGAVQGARYPQVELAMVDL
ncbi:MAG: aldo/keto reductase, partial [Janthinobacterium sp.]